MKRHDEPYRVSYRGPTDKLRHKYFNTLGGAKRFAGRTSGYCRIWGKCEDGLYLKEIIA